MNIINTNGLAGILNMFGPFLPLILIWVLFWKGLALWHASRKGQPWWFVALLILNTLGILEIVYLFAVLKMKFSDLFHKE